MIVLSSPVGENRGVTAGCLKRGAAARGELMPSVYQEAGKGSLGHGSAEVGAKNTVHLETLPEPGKRVDLLKGKLLSWFPLDERRGANPLNVFGENNIWLIAIYFGLPIHTYILVFTA